MGAPCCFSWNNKKESEKSKVGNKGQFIIKESKKDGSKRSFQQRYIFIYQDEHKDEVRVTCEVMDVCTSFEDALKKYDRDNNTEKNKNSETGEYIYSIHLLISDESLDGEVCNAYIYTYDGKGL